MIHDVDDKRANRMNQSRTITTNTLDRKNTYDYTVRKTTKNTAHLYPSWMKKNYFTTIITPMMKSLKKIVAMTFVL